MKANIGDNTYRDLTFKEHQQQQQQHQQFNNNNTNAEKGALTLNRTVFCTGKVSFIIKF